MAKYKAYPEYKDSGVEWLGEIPNHWKTLSISRLFSRIKRTGYTEKELLSVYRDYGVIPKSSRDDNNNKPSEDLSPYQLVEPNDLVMNKMKAWQGSIAISEYEGIVSPAYFVYKPNNVLFELAHPRYVHYLLRNPIYVTQYLSRSKGIRVNQWDLDPDEFRNIELLLPDKTEQGKIYCFLDHETAKIDNLIEKQQQLIELLKEKRQAVISHAVTKGLNPDVPMKDSGVEWLGEVPEHWGVSKVKYYCTIKGRIGFRGYTVQDLVDENEGALVLGASEMRSDGSILLSSPQYISWEKYYESPEIMLDKNMILFVQRGSTVGKVSFITHDLGKATINPSLIVLRDLNICGEFMNYSLMGPFIQNTVKMQTSSTAIPMISQEQVGNYFQLIPPLNEQLKIAEFIASNVSKIDQAINTAEISISLIKERRTALISAAVTGKIDVRDWVAPDTQDVEEPQGATA
ncbi:hypothetical protein SM66_00524 [Klebsiella quasipneumoniae subsp. quasipneumoniae]|uniref:restriction endonuclease subunit S n=1 Tax=Klebsiella TaxID=570 RepID=UPI00065185A8|nr:MULTISPECIES: restriction endonuclease subunit S [Klebsiella]KMH20557.1 hypothetical protein SM66_00524 [Klebsiella quasipneumoniae subsp. quasipneumoniae]MCF8599642.1 restriction endonuclease subunit S [Klebsiella sp. 2019SCSN059]VGE47582.1 restriction endonuclease subunit S [Klebsiella quasipneumoniae]